MNKIIFIRHGMTAGNIERRYIGRTDEPLCPEGITQIEELSKRSLHADSVIVSPMKRAVETACMLFPDKPLLVDDDLRETDFGIFEGRTAEELSADPERSEEYTKWLDTMCRGPVPGGDDINEFKERICSTFCGDVDTIPSGSSAAFVMHGGPIMSVMERFAVPSRDYYDYHIDNGSFIECSWDGEHLRMTGGALC